MRILAKAKIGGVIEIEVDHDEVLFSSKITTKLDLSLELNVAIFLRAVDVLYRD